MKIAYIYINLIPMAGVDQKPIQQAESLGQIKRHDIDVIVLNPDKTRFENGVHYIKFRHNKRFPYFDYLFTHTFNRFSVLKNVDLSQYQCLILRYPKADKSGIRLFKNHPIISEHHGNEYLELKREAHNNPSIPYKLIKHLRAFLEKHYGPKILKHAKGIISMNDETSQYQLSRIPNQIPSISVANGISVSKTKHTKFKPFDGENLNLIFPTGHQLFFHGLDRLIKSAESYSGSCKIHIHLLGNYSEKKIINHPLIHYHGVLKGKAYNDLMEKMNLGVSTLALFRKATNEAASLKTRDFIARGLPFILAYDDTDLIQNPPQMNFCLQIPNNESIPDFTAIINFAKKISHNSHELSNYMRTYAEKYLDWDVKLEKYIRLAEQITEQKK